MLDIALQYEVFSLYPICPMIYICLKVCLFVSASFVRYIIIYYLLRRNKTKIRITFEILKYRIFNSLYLW